MSHSYVDTDRPFCMGQDVCLITSCSQDQRFLSYCLNTLGADQLELARVGSTFTRINVDQIVELRVPVSAQDEQRAVADHLDELKGKTDAIVRGLRRQIVLLQEHRQALTTAAVTRQIDVTTARGGSS
jgi:type I restriction enzyme, S subunit